MTDHLNTITGRKHLTRNGSFYVVFDFFAAREEAETGYPITKSEWRSYHRENEAKGG